MRVVKGDWNGAVSRNNCKKGRSRVGTWTGTLKNPTKCIWRWEPERRPNFFSPPAHLCAIAYITEISLHVTLYRQSLTKISLIVTLSNQHTHTHAYLIFYSTELCRNTATISMLSHVDFMEIKEIWLSPMTKPPIPTKRTTQKRHQKLRLHNDCGFYVMTR